MSVSSFPLRTRAEPALARWRDAVGPPVAIDQAAAGEVPAVPALAVLCWNVWIGRGRLRELVASLRTDGRPEQGIPPGTPLVVLVQEAYREGDAVPGRVAPRAAPRSIAPTGREDDIVAAAESLGLALRYAPSMRNGRHRSDRGSAVLSTLPLEQADAVELPFALQRRVAVAATVRLPRTGAPPLALDVVSAHLDPRGQSARDWLGVLGRGRQAAALCEHLDTRGGGPQILGADLNLVRGAAEPAFRRLAEAGFTPGIPERWPAWPHTYHRWPRLVLDWLLARDSGGALAGVVTHRLDERPDDRGLLVYGSDHHPLLARVDLAGP